MIRRKTRTVRVGNLSIGGTSPISVQTMTNVPLSDVDATVNQIRRMTERGASLVRLAVMTVDDLPHLRTVISRTDIPLCADIHFDYRIALGAIDAGIHKIRINPGNIGSDERTREVVRAAKDRGIPIRIGVNGGSIDRKKYSSPTPEALVDSAMSHAVILEDLGFEDIVVSIKASDVERTVEANELFASQRDYPLHVGLTEAGYGLSCTVQSSIAIGSLLLKGLGDTIRVSLTGDPVEEIDIGYEILSSLGLVDHGVRIVSCPTCGRTDPTIDLASIARDIDSEVKARFASRIKARRARITIAVMGCEVNGPGEASHADLGIAGARSGQFLLFRKGEKVGKFTADKAVEELLKMVDGMIR